MQDIIIIGGSFAGLAAASLLGRARRSVVVLDTGLNRNRFAGHAHNLLGHDGRPPGDILVDARTQLDAYPTVTRKAERAVSVIPSGDHFAVRFESEETLEARKLILAFGVVDVLPDLPGVAECWGQSLFHCPYCHGYEYADRRLGVWVAPQSAVHRLKHFREWTPHLTLLANGAPVDAETEAQIRATGASLVREPIVGLRHFDGEIRAVAVAGAQEVPLDAVIAGFPTRLSSPIAEQLGCALETGFSGPYLRVDEMQRTSVPGVFAAGDIARQAHSLSAAIATGVTAGAACHAELFAGD